MPLTRFNVRLDADQVVALEALARRLAFTRNFAVTWGELLREGARWVLACEGQRPAEVEKVTRNSLHRKGEAHGEG